MALNRLWTSTGKAPERELWCKGTHAIQIRDWVEARQGARSFVSLMQEHGPVPESGRDLIITSWYDAAQLLSVIETVAASEHMSVEDAVEQIARRNAQKDLTGVYRVFLRVLAPTSVLTFLPQLWKQYFRFGTVTMLQNDPGRVAFVTRGIHTRFVPWVRGGWKGFLPETIQVCGGRRPTVSKQLSEHVHADEWDVWTEAEYG